MRRVSTFSALAIGGLVVSACGGSGDAMEEVASTAGDMTVAASDALACYLARGTMAEAQERPSPLQITEFSVGGNEGLLCYGAPSARGRDIMGGLVVYGQPERIGANEPTTIHLAGPASIAGVEVGPGSYSIYAIPGPEEWAFFVNTNWERWGIPIDEAVRSSDIGTFTVPVEAMDEYVETLQYRFEPVEDNTMGNVILEWENTRVTFHVHPGSGA
ncbi:MAG: DUF2911 domain-containing protein [Longimicrobiales bacterium]|jgi:hypothetical protein|nr:DUF2911 domain-containing protein [Longimicrobiales bacterium]